MLNFYELRATLNVRSRPNSYNYFITPMFIVKLVFSQKLVLIEMIFPQIRPCKTQKTEHLPIDKKHKLCYNTRYAHGGVFFAMLMVLLELAKFVS